MASFVDFSIPVLPYLAAVDFKPSSFLDGLALSLVLLLGAVVSLRGVLWDKKDPYYHLYFERPQEQDGDSGLKHQAERNIAEAMGRLDKRIVVFWGSQSGTAEDMGIRLSTELAVRFGLGVMAADLSDYDPASISAIPDTKLAIFVMSTFGEGNPSDNALEFCDFAERKEPLLPSLRYAAFGLGNSNYKYYNKVIDDVCGWLDRRQAKPIMPVGRANDAEGTTGEDFISWKGELIKVLGAYLGIEEKPLRFQTPFAVDEDTCLEPIDLHDGSPVHALKPRALPITLSRELFHGVSDRNCLHLELDLKATPEIRYKTGDHLAVFPVNPSEEVDRLLFALGMAEKKDTPILIRSTDPAVKIKIPTPTSLVTLLRHYLEICALPSRDAVQMLVEFAPSESARRFLSGISSSRKTYLSTTVTHHLTLGRLLLLASNNSPWPALPLAYLVTALHPLQPRYYSISSSSVLSPRQPSITTLVSRTSLSASPTTFIPGLTSSYLHSGPATVVAHVRRSKFHLPGAATTPLVLVAAGTGLAPFRAFVAERAKLHAMGRDVGEMLLFFGCRRRDEDYIYVDELERARDRLPPGRLGIVTAFSREEGKERVYVQDRVREEGERVAKMVVEQGASLYICGRAGMAREVGKTVVKVLEETKGMGKEEAEGLVHGLKSRGKWLEDVWG